MVGEAGPGVRDVAEEEVAAVAGTEAEVVEGSVVAGEMQPHLKFHSVRILWSSGVLWDSAGAW